MKKKGFRGGGKMKTKGYSAGGKMKTKGYKAGGKMKTKGYKAGGKLNMVKGPDGKMVPDYAADGKGKMKKGCYLLSFYLLNHVIHLLVHQNH